MFGVASSDKTRATTRTKWNKGKKILKQSFKLLFFVWGK
jgi:hypothetical protein